MYREKEWLEGNYIDNHRKYDCYICGGAFIVGEENLKRYSVAGKLICPYCGSTAVECTTWTEDEDLEELVSNLGCLAIYLNENREV